MKTKTKTVKKFKQIDPSFIRMKLPSGLPRFASLPYDDYLCDMIAIISVGRGDFEGRTIIRGLRDEYRGAPLGLIVQRYSGLAKIYSAEPSSPIPGSVQLLYHKVKSDFDDMRVAWEATWREASAATPPDDPILYGRNHKDDNYYVLATWDLTKAESYIVDAPEGYVFKEDENI